MDKQKNVAADEYPEFFAIFIPKYNLERMPIPNAFVKCLRGRVLKKAILKSPKGKLWHVNICNINGGDMYFDHGWKQFIKDNSLEDGYFITFSFDGRNTFNFKIYKTNRCEMIETCEEEEDTENDSAVHVKVKDDDDDDDEQVNNRSRKRKCLSSSSKAKHSIINHGIDAEMYVQTDNPYFETKVGGNRKNELHYHTTFLSQTTRTTTNNPSEMLQASSKT